jgi:hypothetical protein
LALKASVYQEVNLVLARTLVETRDSGEMRRLVKWIETVTMEGRNPFFAIELVGNIRTCGCRWADVAQNTRHFIMADDQRDEMLRMMVKDMSQKGTLESVVYNGIITLEQAYYAATKLGEAINFVVREEKCMQNKASKAAELPQKLGALRWFEGRDLEQIIPSMRYGIRQILGPGDYWTRTPLEVLTTQLLLFR